MTIRGRIAGSSQRRMLCIPPRPTDTQPAVAPRPFTCRKIALPRRTSAGSRARYSRPVSDQ